MKSETRKKILLALRKRVQQLLGEIAADEHAARRELSSVLSSPELNRKTLSGAIVDRAFRAGTALALWSEAEKDLKRRPEPKKEELEKFLSEIKSAGVDFALRSSLKKIIRKLPPFPPGKPPKFRAQQQLEILSEVRRLSTTRSRKEAYVEVAKKHHVHWRTIQNLYLRDKVKKSSGGPNL